MEDGVPTQPDAATTAPPPPPPPPPTPTNAEPLASDTTDHGKTDEPQRLESEDWDIYSISALAALRMFVEALESLAEATGNIPPTPPVSRPVTPNKEEERQLELLRISSPEASLSIGSPEAHPHEPLTVSRDAAPDITGQHAAIARRFFSKTPPDFSLEKYLLRMHHYCPYSAGVYLGAASFCHRLCVEELEVPATSRTVHRLALAAIRVSAKAVEDNKWRQKRTAGVGGVSSRSLLHLEIALCYLLDFDLRLHAEELAKGMFLLQQAARQSKSMRGTLGDQFKLKLPMRKAMALARS